MYAVLNISDDCARASDVHIREFTNTPFCTIKIRCGASSSCIARVACCFVWMIGSSQLMEFASPRIIGQPLLWKC